MKATDKKTYQPPSTNRVYFHAGNLMFNVSSNIPMNTDDGSLTSGYIPV